MEQSKIRRAFGPGRVRKAIHQFTFPLPVPNGKFTSTFYHPPRNNFQPQVLRSNSVISQDTRNAQKYKECTAPQQELHFRAPRNPKRADTLWPGGPRNALGCQAGRDSPKMAPRRPNMAPRWPKMTPRWSQDGPRWLKDGPRWPQDGTTWPQDGFQMAPRLPKTVSNTINKLLKTL